MQFKHVLFKGELCSVLTSIVQLMTHPLASLTPQKFLGSRGLSFAFVIQELTTKSDPKE